MPCPLCRKEFTIPDDGLTGLVKNFYIERLIRARNLSRARPLGSRADRDAVGTVTEEGQLKPMCLTGRNVNT